MKTFTKVVLEKNRSIDQITEELFLHTYGDNSKRETILLATVQELANAIIALQHELEVRN